MSAKKNKYQSSSSVKPWVRILACFLAVLMVLGAITYTIFYLFAIDLYAASAKEYSYVDSTPDSDILVRVGLMYGSDVTVGFQTTAPYGFSVGAVVWQNNYEEFLRISQASVSAVYDGNLGKTGMTYTLNPNTSVIGGWHIQFPAYETEKTRAAGGDVAAAFKKQIDDFYSWSRAYLDNVFGACIDGALFIRLGQFESEAEATTTLRNLQQINAIFTDAYVCGPSETCVSLVDPYTDKILFEVSGPEHSLAAAPIQYDGTVTWTDTIYSDISSRALSAGQDTAYTVTPAKNSYAGLFEYKRYRYNGTDGVAVTNILPLEEYATCVLPWEISSSWPEESQKAFALSIRSYTLSLYSKHDYSYGFDMCSTTCCQYYKGIGRVTDKVKKAVSETKGQVITYNNAICQTYYSSSTGGCTADVGQVWGSGGKFPYLKAVATPWEDYPSHSNGSWTKEYSPEQLYQRLYNRGYTDLKGNIDKAEIVQLADNSTYVYRIKFTDIYGNSVTLKNTDTIRIALGLNSANFVVAKAGTNVNRTDFVPMSNSGEIHVMGADGITSTAATDSLYALGSDGTLSSLLIPETGLSIIIENGAIQKADIVQGKLTPKEISLSCVAEVTSVTAEGTPGNFIFIGRGWGHGVGLSQWGTKDLADLGYSYDQIVEAYFSNTTVTDFHSVLSR